VRTSNQRTIVIVVLALCAGVAFGATPPDPDPPMLGIHWQKGAVRPVATVTAPTVDRASPDVSAASKGSGTCSDCLTYHGGPILATTRILPIFWGTSWSNPAFAQDKISGLDNWHTYYPGSDYESETLSQYCSGTTSGATTCTAGANGQTFVRTAKNSGSSGVSYTPGSYVVDTTTAGSGQKTATILSEVCAVIQKKVAAGNFTPTTSDYYPVYVDLPVSGGYCAYHSYGTCSYTPKGGKSTNVNITFAFFWNADGNVGCSSGDGPYVTAPGGSYPVSTLTGHSEGLGSLADSTAHELAETRTDPSSPRAWTDASGSEIGDKCEWNTGYPGQVVGNAPVVKFLDNTAWVLQPLWSNLEAIDTSTRSTPPTFLPDTFAQQSLSSKGAASGSYGCVYGLSRPLNLTGAY